MSGYWHSGGRQCISWHRQTGLLSAQSRAGTGYVEWVTAFSVTWCDGQEIKPISKSVRTMPTQRTEESLHIRSPINHRSPSGNFINDNIIIGRLRFGFKEENRPKGIKMCCPLPLQTDRTVMHMRSVYTMPWRNDRSWLFFITQTYKLDFLYIWIKELASPPRTIRCITIATLLIE